MYEFLIVCCLSPLPRVRDFAAHRQVFDGRGNYSMGVKSRSFSGNRLRQDRCSVVHITLTTTARSDDEGRALLRAFKFPFRN
jgi:large subunit ribosomal protein L5